MNINTCKLTSQIVLAPHEMVNIPSALRRHLEEKIGTCNKEYGYIMDVGEMDPYAMPLISKISGNCIYDITYEIKTLKPEPGQIYQAQIQNIFPDGMFTQYKNIQIFIPTATAKAEATSKAKVVGDIVTVTILFIRYENHRFRCIGKI